ncbi:MAG: DUF3486 family protein [Zoogloeaceae bacterium]|jgi:hypothetical protein|nr:DUF3486 family protein [Zoogloeaceae bacterium]
MKRSLVHTLPPEVIEALNALLIQKSFTDYSGIVEWLAERGFVISRSSVYRHGKELEAEFEEAMADARRSRALARAAREAGGEEDGALLAAASEIMQDNLLRVSLKLKDGDDPAETAKTLATLSRAFADVGRFDIARQKWQQETRTKIEALEKQSGKGGTTLDAKTLQAVKEALYG